MGRLIFYRLRWFFAIAAFILNDCSHHHVGWPDPVPDKSHALPLIIASGSAHTCRTQSNGTVVCWGDNRFGQLGNGTTVDSQTPVEVVGLTSAVALTAGDWHTCAVLLTGEVKCWGGNKLGQLGNTALRPSLTPVLVPIAPAINIAAGRTHTCALLSNGTLSCWGDNRNSQTGVQRESRAKPALPVIVPGVTNVVSVAAGNEHSCAVQSDGKLFCWGDNHFGQLGHGIQAHQFFPPRLVPILGEAVSVTAGRRHTCALLRDKTVQCWGKGFEGQLGDGAKKDSLMPVRVATFTPNSESIPLENVAAISAGSQHTCALLENRRVYCWGNNISGQLGLVNEEMVSRPTFSGLTDVASLGVGGWHTCVILFNGEERCLGKIQTPGPED